MLKVINPAALQIVVAGLSDSFVVYLARLNVDGTFDATFGTGGSVTSTLGPSISAGINQVGMTLADDVFTAAGAPMDAAAAVDAKSAPTAARKTPRTRFPQRPQASCEAVRPLV